MSILNVPPETQLGSCIINYTAIIRASSFSRYNDGSYFDSQDDVVNQWLKNMNNDEKFSLHRACSSFQPLKQVISAIVLQKGIKAFREENSAGITPSQYLKENPYTNLTEMEIVQDYLMKMMGEVE